jgi:LytR cell envelope-related transcriptional attenuator
VDAPISPQELIRPWRTATVVASTVAAIELVLLIGAATFLLAKPISRALHDRAATTASAPAKHKRSAVAKAAPPVKRVAVPVAKPRLTRAETRVVVLNGNGRQGAAAQGAARLRSFGYAIAGTENARRQDYAATVVMYRAGYRAEGLRLAHDLKVKVVGPLDGLAPSALRGGQLAIVIGA